jgi:hypothetical protein
MNTDAFSRASSLNALREARNGSEVRLIRAGPWAVVWRLDLLGEASVAIDGSKFKAVNNRDKNFTEAKMKRRLEQIDESIARLLFRPSQKLTFCERRVVPAY